MLLSRTFRFGIVTMAACTVTLALGTVSATARVDASCAASQARASALEGKLASVHERIDARTAQIADAGHDLSRVNNWESRLARARRHEDRIREKIAAVTKRCQS